MGLGTFFKNLFGGGKEPTSGTETRPNTPIENFGNKPQNATPETISEIEKDEEIRTDHFTHDKNNREEDLND